VFKSIPVSEYRKNVDIVKQADEAGAVDNILDILTNRFIEGKIMSEGKDTDVDKTDLGELGIDVIVRVYRFLTGQEESPKV